MAIISGGTPWRIAGVDCLPEMTTLHHYLHQNCPLRLVGSRELRPVPPIARIPRSCALEPDAASVLSVILASGVAGEEGDLSPVLDTAESPSYLPEVPLPIAAGRISGSGTECRSRSLNAKC